MINDISELSFDKTEILIIGDIMLDKYYYGSVSRISPEAPVPIVNVKSEVCTMGGAGNVANNIRGLTANCRVIGCASDDEAGNTLYTMFKKIGAESVFIDAGIPTISKLRVVGSKQQIVRLDFEEIRAFSDEVNISFKNAVDENIDSCNVIVISDYGKGVCSEEICQHIINRAKEKGKPVIIDPKGSVWNKYMNASIITPNVKELSEVAGKEIPNEDHYIIETGRLILKKYNIEHLIVTRSEKGITVISGNTHKTIPTVAKEVFDVSGAGDTVVSCLAVFLGLGFCLEDASVIANAAAGIVVGKLGTAPIFLSELSCSLNGVHGNKIISIDNIENIIDRERAFDRKIVFTNGCFDILHHGHISYLKKAKGLGDRLVLGLNSDDSVRRLKGKDRPVNSQSDRAAVLEALECIDYIVIFEEDTPLELIKKVRPDILVKGGDYMAEDVVGGQYAASVRIIDFLDGYSTTSTIKKINGENK